MTELLVKSEKTLSLIPWSKCNAKCRHCGQNSSNQAGDIIRDEHIFQLIKEAGKLYNSNWILSLTGGEPFLKFDKLVEYVCSAKKNKGYTTIMTNCYWGTTIDSAMKKLQILKNNGLKLLGVSYDNFHEEFISLENVKNVIKAAQSLLLPVMVKVVASRDYRLSVFVLGIQNINPWFVNFIEMPLIKEGRALSLPSDLFIYNDKIPAGKCPGLSMTINSKGQAMICCNGGGAFNSLQVGNIYDFSLEELEYQYFSNPLSMLLINKGPLSALDYLDELEKETILKRKYVSECDLCTYIFSNENIGNKIKTSVEDLFIKTVGNQIKFSMKDEKRAKKKKT